MYLEWDDLGWAAGRRAVHEPNSVRDPFHYIRVRHTHLEVWYLTIDHCRNYLGIWYPTSERLLNHLVVL